jgi:hypothetical protein
VFPEWFFTEVRASALVKEQTEAVSSELLPDVLNGLVAIGTLTLAGATAFVSHAATRAAVDAASPRVFVDWLRADFGPLKKVPKGAMLLDQRMPWDMARQGHDEIGLRFESYLHNEGNVSALIRFDKFAGTEIDQIKNGAIGSPQDSRKPLPIQSQGDWYVVPPNGVLRFRVTWWQLASVWAREYGPTQRASSSTSLRTPPKAKIRLNVRGASGDALDRCDLIFGGYALVFHSEDKWMIPEFDSGLPGPAAELVTEIGLMRRSYSNPLYRVWRKVRGEIAGIRSRITDHRAV